MFTDGSALGNPGPTGTGAVIYYKGLEEERICISKPVCSNGGNYFGELIGIQTALQHLAEQLNKKSTIHIFVDCHPAIIAAFSTEITKHNVDMNLNIRQTSSILQNNGHNLSVHWIPGLWRGSRQVSSYNVDETRGYRKMVEDISQFLKIWPFTISYDHRSRNTAT